MSPSETLQIMLAATGVASFTLGALWWLITPRLVDVIERTVNGKIDSLSSTVDANAADAARRYDEQKTHQANMLGEIRVSAERHKNVLAAIDYVSAAVEANTDRIKDNTRGIARLEQRG